MENTTSSDQPSQVATSKPLSEAAKINQVLTWILQGNSEHLIVEAIESTWPGEAARPLILGAFRQVAANAELTRDTLADWCVESMRFLYQKQVEIGEYGGAMRAVRELAAMAGRRSGGKDKPKPAEEGESFPRVLNVDDRRRSLAERIAKRG